MLLNYFVFPKADVRWALLTKMQRGCRKAQRCKIH